MNEKNYYKKYYLTHYEELRKKRLRNYRLHREEMRLKARRYYQRHIISVYDPMFPEIFDQIWEDVKKGKI